MKYAVEIANTKSISRAAENLYMGQPNLSRAIRELEESLGITIFMRSSRGVVPTEQGREFLNYAQKNGAVVSLSEELPQSYVLADAPVDTVYLSELSSTAMKKRTEAPF